MTTILEQEDLVKGLPDEILFQKAENPDGIIPPFLYVSEIQRRTNMRQRFQNSEPPGEGTVTEHVIAEGLASANPQMAPMAPMDQMDMAVMPTSSPVPVTPNSSSPSFPVGDAHEGLAGMGVQYASTGGVIGMQDGGQLPYNRTHLAGRAIIERSGRDWRDFNDDYIEAVGRASYRFQDPRSFKPGLGSARDPEEYQQLFGTPPETGDTISLQEIEKSRLPVPEVIDKYNTAEEFYTETGIDPDAPTKWEEAESEFDERVADAERYPYRNLDPELKSEVPWGQRFMLGLREGVREVGDVVGTLGPTAGEAVLDAVTVGATGELSDPEAQREQALEEITGLSGQPEIQALTEGFRNEAAKLSTDGGEWWDALTGVGGTIKHGAGVLADEYIPEGIIDAIGGVAEDVTSRGGVLWDELVSGRSDLEMEDLPFIQLGPIWLANQIGGFFDDDESQNVRDNSQVANNPAFQEDAARGGFPTSSQETLMKNILAGGPQPRDFAGGNMITDSLVRNAMREGIDEGIGGKSMQDLDEARGMFDAAQEDQATNLQELINRTREEAKSRAFYMGIAALGAGIAQGDIGKGMESAVEVASETAARGEAAVAPLEAAAATQPAQAAKDRIDALAAIARADATFQNVQAQLTREGGLDRRSYNQLRGYAIRAAQQAIGDMDYMEGLDTPEAIAKAISQIADQMMGDVAPLMQPTGSELFRPNADGSYSFIGQLPE